MLGGIDDALIWLGGVASGFAVMAAAWALVTKIRLAGDVLLGKWYGYSYFYDSDRVRFYKETIWIRRSRLFPWRMMHFTTPSGGDSPSGYHGPITFHTPYIYASAFERSSGDRTFDLGRLVMDGDHEYKMIVAIHLGDSYEETVHSASAYLWVRSQLDPTTNERTAPNESEEAEFRRLVSRFIKVDKDHLQIQLTPPRRMGVAGSKG